MRRRDFLAGMAAFAGSGCSQAPTVETLPVELTSPEPAPLSFLPPGDTFGRMDLDGAWRAVRLFADGITRENIDFAWDVSRGDQDLAVVFPVAQDDGSPLRVGYYYWDSENVQRQLGSFAIKWAASPLVSPTIPQVIVPFGDSTMSHRPFINPGDRSLGNVPEGCWLNEVSRQLTGVGEPLIFYAQDLATGEYRRAPYPPPGALTNIKFVGTMGLGPIKHEGRAGWRMLDYITKAQRRQVNAFWNPDAEGDYKIDLAYYLRQNGFMADQMEGGALPDYSNVTVAIWFGWNEVYTGFTDEEIRTNAGILLDRFHETAPGAKVVWFGLIAPPDTIFKSLRLDEELAGEGASGTRIVSPRTIFEVATRRMGTLYREVCSSRPWAEFYQVSHLVNPETAFPKVSFPISARSFEEIEGSSDFVHPQAQGYADFADVIAKYFAYRMCSGFQV